MNVLLGAASPLADSNAALASVDELMEDNGSAPSAAPEPGRRRSVGSMLRLKSKKSKEQQRDSDPAAHSASETSLESKKKSGFLRKMKKQKVKDSDTDQDKPSPPSSGKLSKSSKAATLVRKLSMGRSSSKTKDKQPAAVVPVADPETSDEEVYYSNTSSTAPESVGEGYATPVDTPPPPPAPPLTPPPMEADEDQSHGGSGSAGVGGGGTRNPDRERHEPPAVASVTLPGQDEAPQQQADDDMKGDRRQPGSATGAIKKVPKGAKNSQNMVDEEKKSTRSQLLSITTPALQKQLNGQAAAAAAAAKSSTPSPGPSPSAGPGASPSPSPSAPPAPAPAPATPKPKQETPSSGQDKPQPQPDTPSPTTQAPAKTEIRVIAEVGGPTPNGSENTTSNGSAPPLDSSTTLDSNPPTPSTGDLMADARNKLSQSLGIHDSAQMSGEKREHLYKILVIGELGTGKTSIIKRYVHQFFSQHYRATIGVDFALKVLNWDASTIIRLQLWDIAGQERFGNMTRVYYKEAVGAFIVFDVTRAGTFDAVVKWKQDLDSKVQMYDGSPIPCVLLANKCDQQKEGLVNSPAKMDDYCREKGFTAWFETSAKENVNIEEAARALVSKILQNEKLLLGNDMKDPSKIALDNNGKAAGDTSSAKSCAC